MFFCFLPIFDIPKEKNVNFTANSSIFIVTYLFKVKRVLSCNAL